MRGGTPADAMPVTRARGVRPCAVTAASDAARLTTEFRKAISLDPKYARAYTNLGSALAKNGQLAEAVDVFRKALALDPNPATALPERAETCC